MITSTAVDGDADHPVATTTNGSRRAPPPPPPPPPAASNDFDPAAAADGLGNYAGSIMDIFFFPPPPPPPPQSMAEPQQPSYYRYDPQPQGFHFQPCCSATAAALDDDPAVGTPVRPERLLQVPPTTTMATPSLYYPQTTMTGGCSSAASAAASSVEEAYPAALAVTPQQQARQDDNNDTKPTAPRRRRGRPPKRAATVSVSVSVSESSPPPAKRVAVGQVLPVGRPDQAGSGASSGSSTSGQQTAACTTSTIICVHPPPAATAPPPEVVTTTTTKGAGSGPPPIIYADTSAAGVRFDPTDQQLIEYLRMKHHSRQQEQQKMPVDFFREFDVYQAHPTAIRGGACGESQNGCWYAFSPRERKYRNGARPARSVYAEIAGGSGGKKKKKVQVGFWKSNSKLGVVREGGRADGAVIGRKTSLTFQVGVQPRGTQTGWKMKEYTIPENQHQPDGSAMLLNDWVFCKLFYKERPLGCENTESKTDDSATSVGVGQKRTRRSRKSKKDKDAIALAVGLQEHEPAGEGEAGANEPQGEEDHMQQMMILPAAHQASDYSEQDLCVDDYLVCDVAFAQQDDTANCTV